MRVYADERIRRAAQNQRRKLARTTRLPVFVGVDGEGVTDDDTGQHSYVLLSVGSAHYTNPAGLGFSEICQFLYSRFRINPQAVYGGYFLGYDFTQWLRTLPANRAAMLLSERGRAARARKRSGANTVPFPVSYDGWEFDILGFKRFKLRPEGGKHAWMYINDCGSFFQTSLLSAVDPDKWETPILSDSEYRILSAGKERRSTAVLDADMLEYNALENDVFSRLMSQMAEGFRAAGVSLRRNQWFGPGQAAQAWLATVGVPDTATLLANSDTLVRFLDAARLTYFGGWFEIFCHGHIPGTSHEYDLNSAYPHIIAGLPCLLHGRWTNDNPVQANAISIVRAKVQGNNPVCGSMLHRMPDGNIRRPQYTEGWFWQHEIDAAILAGVINVDGVEYLERMTYEPCSCPNPLAALSDLYQLRLDRGKNTAMGKAFKLLYNSVYGKFAQSVGSPRFGNSIYASLITAGCRTLILKAIASHPKGTADLLMVATDGVYFRTEHPQLPISQILGEWSHETHENLTLFKPGIYWDDTVRQRIAAGSLPVFKSRGISAVAFSRSIQDIDNQFSQWPEIYPAERDPAGDRHAWYPQVTFHTGFAMVTAVQAVAWGHWERCGQLGHRDPHPSGCNGCTGAHLVQDSDPITKRHSGVYDRGVYRSCPYASGGWSTVSAPYERRFGAGDIPADQHVTPDGNSFQEIRWTLLTR